MEVVTGALPRVITKLGDLLVGEYNLQKGVKGEIRFLQSELESMKGAFEKLSNTPADQLDIQDKIWARDLRELSYDIEDNIDTFMVRGKGNESAKLQGIKRFVDRSVGLFRKAKIRHGIANEIRDIKSRVVEVHERRLRYDVKNCADRHTSTMVDPRLSYQYTEAKELVGIDETRDELVKILMDVNGMPLQQGKIVSIVGFGGLGKTTLAKAVYEKIRALFDCCAFVSVSQTPDLKKLFKELLYDLDKSINAEILDERQIINVLREFLQAKRYLIVIDDIWDISVWKVIKCAFPDNDDGYIVVTTTRNTDVAEKAGGAYKLKPLSENNSRKLLYRRVFGNESSNNVEATEKCPDEELAEVSDRILMKCAGVPLAIITMASLLACKPRNKMDWYEVYHSIGTGLEHNLDVQNMRKILAFSYYNMPSHLKICLLYFTIFPEDYEVKKDRLIWMWIAEGFLQCQNQGRTLFELGESYFNELINRSMIQPIYSLEEDTIYACRIHDMVLDLICSLSTQANFVTLINGVGQTYPSSMIRRLSIQNGREDDIITPKTRCLQQVRSVVVLRQTSSLIPVLGSFHVLRVLDLEHCDLSHDYRLLKCLGNLFHLRYLGLCDTHIVELPEEIGNLQFLQILDIRGNNISCLPLNVVKLKHLMCLSIEQSTRVPKGIGSLTSLEKLSDLHVDDSNMDIILEELGQLSELRVLCILLGGWSSKLVECLNKLQKIQELSIYVVGDQKNIGGLDTWVGPRCLRDLDLRRAGLFSTLPAWMNPSHLPCLSSLSITVREIQQGDLDILGTLHALRHLELRVGNENFGTLCWFVVSAGAFPCLIRCVLLGFVKPVVFQQGTMPRLRTLWFGCSVREANETASCDGVGPDFGLGFLPSLQEIYVRLNSTGACEEETEELKATLLHASKIHPNHPSLLIKDI